MKKIIKKVTVMTELILKQRGSWHGVLPVTKVIGDKTKYSRKGLKRKSNDFEE
jgi:hypothetical protein